MAGLSGKKGKLLEGGIRVPGIIEWPNIIRKNRITNVPANTVDIYPTILELAGIKQPANQPLLDGVSLAPLIQGETFVRKKPMGFWHYPAGGRGMHAHKMLEALRAEQVAGNQAPAPKAGFVDKKYPLDKFPGASAWISGDWKLHRVANKAGINPAYRLYNLKKDVQEKTDLAAAQPEVLTRLKGELAAWQKSVVSSLNGKDYR
jgi:hypothetical protein